MNHWYRRQI